MAIAPIVKAHVFAHASRKEELLSSLQEAGVIQIEEIGFEGIGFRSYEADISEIDRTLIRLKRVLNMFASWERIGALKKLLAAKPLLSLRRKRDILAFDFGRILDKMERLEREKSDRFAEIRLLEKESHFLEPLRSFPLPLDVFRGTRTTQTKLIAISPAEIEKLAASAEGCPFWYEIVRWDKRKSHVFLIYSRDSKEDVESVLNDLQADVLSLDAHMEKAGPGDTVENLLKKNRTEGAEKKKDVQSLEEEMKALAVHRRALMAAHDVLLNEREKMLAARRLGETDKTICLEGWIRAADKAPLSKRIALIAETAQVYFRPPLPEEEPPVFLENSTMARPFEIITGLYGLPARGILDPTASLAPFFFIFVGLCVSEAGYGLILTVLSLLFLKFGRPGSGGKLFAKLALYLGVSNIIFGTLFGGWFGFPIRPLLLIDPLKDPISFLGLTLGLGFIQVWFGTLLSMINSLKNKCFAQAVFVKGGWLLFLPGLILYFLTKHAAAGILAAAGAAGIIFFSNPSRNLLARFFGGLYGLYGISGYVSDTLSYSRILALGLSTGVIAMVVNNLTQTAFKIPVLGWVLAPFVFVGGHLFNMGIGFLGGFVHSMRLQFVEFFTKFYRGGGKPFKPFRVESNFMEIVE